MDSSEQREESTICPNHSSANWVEDPYHHRIRGVLKEVIAILDAPHPDEDCLALSAIRESLMGIGERLMDMQLRQDPYVAWLNGEIQGSEAQIKMWAGRSPWSKAILISASNLTCEGQEAIRRVEQEGE